MKKKKSAKTLLMQNAPAHTPKAQDSQTSNNSISQPEQNVNSKKTENIKPSARLQTIDNYTEIQYNNYGWARANNVLSSTENSQAHSMYMRVASKLVNAPKNNLGEYMIAVGKDGINNKIVFMKGDVEAPEITRILEIDADNETFLSERREEVYEAECKGIQAKTSRIFKIYYAADYGYKSYLRQTDSRKNVGHNNKLGIVGGTGSRKTARVKEILFDDNGNEISRKYSARSNMCTGQIGKMKANYTHEKVYSKKTAFDIISRFSSAKDFKAKTREAIAESLWKGLNSCQSIEERNTFAHDTAVFVIGKMLSESRVNNPEAEAAKEKLA